MRRSTHAAATVGDVWMHRLRQPGRLSPGPWLCGPASRRECYFGRCEPGVRGCGRQTFARGWSAGNPYDGPRSCPGGQTVQGLRSWSCAPRRPSDSPERRRSASTVSGDSPDRCRSLCHRGPVNRCQSRVVRFRRVRFEIGAPGGPTHRGEAGRIGHRAGDAGRQRARIARFNRESRCARPRSCSPWPPGGMRGRVVLRRRPRSGSAACPRTTPTERP